MVIILTIELEVLTPYAMRVIDCCSYNNVMEVDRFAIKRILCFPNYI